MTCTLFPEAGAFLMLLWLTLSIAIALCALAIAVVVMMRRAERRARHALYVALGVGDDLIAALMTQKGPVSAQMALVRQTSIIAGPRPDEMPSRDGGHRAFRYTRALNGTRTASQARAARRNTAQDHRDPS